MNEPKEASVIKELWETVRSLADSNESIVQDKDLRIRKSFGLYNFAARSSPCATTLRKATEAR
jgi:hypothetical protein